MQRRRILISILTAGRDSGNARRLRVERRRLHRRHEGARPDHHLVLQQRAGGAVGQGDGEPWNSGAPERADQGPGDPGRQEHRRGHRRRDHRGHHALPGVQQPRPPRPASSRRRAASSTCRSFPDGDAVHRGAQRDARRPVQVARRRLLPDALEVQPGDDLLQQGRCSRRPGSTPRTPSCRPTTSSSPRRKQIKSPGRRRTRSTRRRPASSSRSSSTSSRCTRRRPAASRSSRTARRRSTEPEAIDVANFWKTIYSEGLAGKETVPGRLVRRQQGRHGHRRSVGHRGLRRQGEVGLGARSRPRTECRPTRPTPSPTRRTSACTRRARTRARRGMC